MPALPLPLGTTGNNPATITAVAPGTASITAACSPPNCNNSFPNAPPAYIVYPQYSQNVVTASVSGATTTTVYAASTNSTTLVPISTSTNTAGTAVTLPNLPNSALMDPTGSYLYLGSSSGLMQVNLLTNAVTAYSVNGTVVAISPDSRYLLISDSVANDVYYFDTNIRPSSTTSAGFTTSSSHYTPDSKFNEWVSGTDIDVRFSDRCGAGFPRQRHDDLAVHSRSTGHNRAGWTDLHHRQQSQPG